MHAATLSAVGDSGRASGCQRKLSKCNSHDKTYINTLFLSRLFVLITSLSMASIPAYSAKNTDTATDTKSAPSTAKSAASTAKSAASAAKSAPSTAKSAASIAKSTASTSNAPGASTGAELLAKARRAKEMFEDEEAIKAYTQYLTAHPDDEKARAERADELRNETRFDECISDYQMLMKSKNFGIASNAATDLGKLYQKRKNYPEAIKTFKFARSLGVRTLLTEISDCARLSGDNETALQFSNEVIKNGEIFGGRIRRANAYLAMNKPKLALEDSNFLVNLQLKAIAKTDIESRQIYSEKKKLVEALEAREQCYEALKEPKLAQQDKEAITSVQREAYNEMPFLIKEKH